MSFGHDQYVKDRIERGVQDRIIQITDNRGLLPQSWNLRGKGPHQSMKFSILGERSELKMRK